MAFSVDIIASTNDETSWRSGRSDESPFLRVLRDVSHTCAAWRNTLLSSPSLWGKCLNFDELFSSGEAWRMEVIRRSGDAPLYVTRLSEDPYPDEDEAEDWLMATFIKRESNPFAEHHSNLMSCKCFFYRKDDDGSRHEYPQKQYYATAMGGGAPCLRTLDINSTELYPFAVLNITIPAEPQRLSQLRELQINPAFDEVKLVEALSSASPLLLETLSVQFVLSGTRDTGNDLHAVTFPPISPTKIHRSSLPSLQKLTIYTILDMRSAIYFLNGIDMAAGNFNLKLDTFLDELSRKDTKDLAGLLSVYFHHFKGRPLSVQTEPLIIKVLAISIHISDGSRDFAMSLRSNTAIPHMSSLFQPFADSLWYEAAEELKLRLGLPHSDDVPSLRILLASLTSVRRIFTSEGDFEAIHSWGRLGDCGELLPALEEVQVAGIRGRAGIDEFGVTVQKFASHRTACRGKPIKLNYSTWDGSGRRVDHCASFAD